MLRNRSRAVTTKQALMADQNSFLSTTKNPTTPVSSFLGSPRIFNGFLSKTISYAEAVVMSPTSILDTKNSSNFVNPFGYDKNLSKPPNPSPEIINKSSSNKPEPKAIGLALIDSINEEKTDEKFSKPINRMVLFGAKLKVQIPTINSQLESPNSPADFGIKTRDSQLLNPLISGTPAKDLTRQLSLKEMELSEDYTCVITHGPNPKTTHIFDDCIMESCCENDTQLPHHKKIESEFETNFPKSPSLNFLSFCHTCKENLEQGKDIYIYRGEKAFCSHECRFQEMVIEGLKNPEMDG